MTCNGPDYGAEFAMDGQMRDTGVPSYCVFDGLHWNSTRGLGRFAGQLRRHLQEMPWGQLAYSRPPWVSGPGRILLNEIVEPLWREALAPDVAIYPHNVLPSLFATHRSLRVLVLHDVLFLEAGTNRSLGNRYRSLKLKQSLARADLILTVSQASRFEILKLLNRSVEVLVIPNALAEGFVEVPEVVRRKRTGTASVFHFGGHAPTKNTRMVLKAVGLLNRSGHDVRLVLGAMAGNRPLVEQWRQEAQLASGALTVLPSLSDEELRGLYAEADVHCMPSTGEGFGIPVIEAARCGTPNVLSPLAVFHELLGDDAIFAHAPDAGNIAAAILRCLNSDVHAMTQRARNRTNRFLFECVHRTDALPALRAIEELVISRRKGRVR